MNATSLITRGQELFTRLTIRGRFHAKQPFAFSDSYGHNGSVVHLDVLNFHNKPWRGHKFWITATPYHNMTYVEENPCIWYGDSPTDFSEAGNNPKYFAPSQENGPKWLSDPDFALDHETDELVMVFRDGDFNSRIARSADGVNWPPIDELPVIDLSAAGSEEKVCPVITFDGNLWHLWVINHPSHKMFHWTAKQVGTSWDFQGECTGWNTDIWHFNIVFRDGIFYCLMHENPWRGFTFAATSSNGTDWVKNPKPLLYTRKVTVNRLLEKVVKNPRIRALLDRWDAQELYRGAIEFSDTPGYMDMWYPGRSLTSDSWRVGYTRVPLSEWPTPPGL